MRKLIGLFILLAVFAVLALDDFDRTDRVQDSRVRFPNGREIVVEIADDDLERLRGLSGRESLDTDRGLLFLHQVKEEQDYWMKDMSFAIDIMWIDGETVIGIVQNAQPEDPPVTIYTSNGPVDKVLEVQAGFVEKNSVRVGDTLDIQLIDE